MSVSKQKRGSVLFLLQITLSLFALIVFGACDDDDSKTTIASDATLAGEETSDLGIAGEVAGIAAGESAGESAGETAGMTAGTSVVERAAWTLLVYSAADNNLESNQLSDIVELSNIGYSDSVNLVIQVDRSALPRAVEEGEEEEDVKPGFSDAPLGDNIENFVGTKRLLISGERNFTELEDLGDVDSGHPDTLRDFIIWGVQNFPADRYILVIGSHGVAINGIAQDEDRDSIISLAQLDGALREALVTVGLDRFDLIGFDACLMATLEVAAVVKPYADYLIASANVEPGHGWNYNSFSLLKDHPDLDIETLGREVLSGFVEVARNTTKFPTITLSLLDLSKVDALVQAVANYGSALQSKLLQGARDLISASLQSGEKYGEKDPRYPIPQYGGMYDLKTFVEKTAEAGLELTSKKDEVLSALDQLIIHQVNGKNFEHTGGLAIHFKRGESSRTSTYDSIVSVNQELADWRDLIVSHKREFLSLRAPEVEGDGSAQLSKTLSLNLKMRFNRETIGRLYDSKTLFNIGSVGVESCDYLLRYTSDIIEIDTTSGEIEMRWPLKRVIIKLGELSFEPHWVVSKSASGYRFSTIVDYFEGSAKNQLSLNLSFSENFELRSQQLVSLNEGNGVSPTDLSPALGSKLRFKQFCQVGVSPQGLTTMLRSPETSTIELTSPLFNADQEISYEVVDRDGNGQDFVLFDYQDQRFFTWMGKLNEL